jgi:hypothetical protein
MKRAPFYLAMVVAFGSLYVLADIHPVMALAAGGFIAALVVAIGKKTSLPTADLFALVLGVLILFMNRFGWTTVVLLPSLMIGSVWLRLGRKRLELDDHLYLPLLMIALGIGILLFFRRQILGYREAFSLLCGLTDVLTSLHQILLDGAEQLTGEMREEYLALVENIQAQFPYYYIGAQIMAFTLVMNFILRVQRQSGDQWQPVLFLKIKEKYVFLLICGLGIEIVRYLFDQKQFLYVSRSIFVVLGATYFLAGLAVLGFLILTKRLRTDSFFSRWFVLMLLFLIIIKPVICMAIGLLDIWFDFRRLKILKGGSMA